MSHDRPENDSTIPPISLPPGGFQSRIPDSLLKDKSDEEIYVYTEVGKMSHFIDWAAPLLVDSNLQQRKTNGRVNRLESESDDRETVRQSWRHTAKDVVTWVSFGAVVVEGLWYVFNFHSK